MTRTATIARPDTAPTAATLSDNPSKSEELDYFRRWLAQLPRNSYLHEYLANGIELMAEAMSNDFCCDPIAEIRSRTLTALQEENDYRERAAAARKDYQLARQEFDRLTLAAARFRQELADLVATAGRLANDCSRAHARTATLCK